MPGRSPAKRRCPGNTLNDRCKAYRLGIRPCLAEEAAPQDTAAEPEVTSGAFLLDLPSGAVSPLRPEEVPVMFEPRALDLPVAARLARVSGPQFLSADGRHVLSSELVADDTVWDKYRWTIYDRDTGERVGEFRTYLPLAPFFVLDSEVVYETGPYVRQSETGPIEEPLKVRAVDLQTGQELWSQPVRDTTYRGPFPP